MPIYSIVHPCRRSGFRLTSPQLELSSMVIHGPPPQAIRISIGPMEHGERPKLCTVCYAHCDLPILIAVSKRVGTASEEND